ncbi:hypothetical protein SynRS9909_00685 [Synechococcus sp. RS9909]|uniref:hypothetical protein n=1 Tax=Synechococcus sp. RS9909 TaxID=221352 RepID=UPI001648F3CB|nr:hypothetical protein [Synechococcus sp. RS9909]QNI78683.1 hypothetical protein SynRS9909_00685 [Synechococcus sp. RS9909]
MATAIQYVRQATHIKKTGFRSAVQQFSSSAVQQFSSSAVQQLIALPKTAFA